MDLTMKQNRTGVQFMLSDDEAETVVSLTPGDDGDTIRRKLRKVLELAGADIEAELHSRKMALYRLVTGPVTEEEGDIPLGPDFEIIPPDQRRGVGLDE